MTNPNRPRYRQGRISRWVMLTLLAALGVLLYNRYAIQHPVTYDDDLEHFKYGSIGSDIDNGIPYWAWQVLPLAFPELLPDPQAFLALPPEKRTPEQGWRQFGWLFEPGHDLPIGFSRRRVTVELIGNNCAMCHVSAMAVNEGMDPARLYGKQAAIIDDSGRSRALVFGMPAVTLDLESYFKFLFACASSGKWSDDRILGFIDAELKRRGEKLDPIERLVYRYVALPRLRDVLLLRRTQLEFLYADPVTQKPPYGPGRVDTFNPYKGIQFGWPKDGTLGTADFPAIWNQRPRETMDLHWDGNNTSVWERNISASLGAGVTPANLDVDRLLRVARWCGAPDPREDIPESDRARRGREARKDPFPHPGEMQIPAFPYEIDQGRAARGKPIYEAHCATCHGWEGPLVGKVVPVNQIGTDPNRLESYTPAMPPNQWMLGSDYWWRFKHFHKTQGYSNHPLDGTWAQAPYLHNGSVPTMWDLLQKQAERPETFYRGDYEYDPKHMGFRSDRDTIENGKRLFLYNTKLRGNDNRGHEYGTDLSVEEKWDLIEYLKTIGQRSFKG